MEHEHFLYEPNSEGFSEFEIDFSEYEVDHHLHSSGIGMDEVHREFNARTLEAGLRFGDEEQHGIFTAVFLAALATKPFVIMSGLSGSGKTHLATTFGEWLGRDHVLVQPVRPDWDSPGALLGSEDLVSETEDKRSWYAPRTLQFILKAVHDPTQPYLLVLEEMNLAHVERYFADVLSGMESGQPIVPNLTHDGAGWNLSAQGDDYFPWPRNVFLVGTVNVDETTYEFSPKVLDRAGVVEFRVSTESLLTRYPKRKPIAPADPALLKAFLQRTQEDEAWWDGRDTVAAWMQTVHRMFSKRTSAFGHRVFRDGLRFGSMLNELGVKDLHTILDQILVQRIIPKFDTKRGFNQSLLLDLAGFAAFGPANAMPVDPLDAPDEDVVLPETLKKLRRIAVDNTHLL